jgi:hypothetical protein
LGFSAFVAAAAPAPPQIRQALWLAPGVDVARALLIEPGRCEPAQLSPSGEIGRALFKSAGLFGGPAGRLGLSCDACHTNGRANAHFFLPELTDRAGHADVTSGWSSTSRNDGILNARPIPDLAGFAKRAQLMPGGELALRGFVKGVIEEEFQGAPPSAAMIDGLMAYLAALDKAACQPDAPLTLATATSDVQRAAAAMASSTDLQTRAALRFAARDRIGRIVERLPAATFPGARAGLEQLARELAVIDAPALPGWVARFDGQIAAIVRRERATHFDQATLARAFNPPSTHKRVAPSRGAS